MGTVDFAGDVMGSTQILAGETLSRIITSKMSERPLEDIKDEDEIKDVVGEMCNIVGGNLKAGFCDSGLMCEISPPSIIFGNDFKVELLNMARYEHFTFRFDEHDIFIQICAKIDESKQTLDRMADDAGEEAFEAGEPMQTVENLAIAQSPEIGNGAESTNNITGRNATSNNLDIILDIPIEVSVELGRTRMKIQEVSMLEAGASIILANTEGEPLDILANGRLIAKGEIVVENGKYGIRITEVVNRMERIKKMG
jgi:flagellar motor switch protein FliN/FliY